MNLTQKSEYLDLKVEIIWGKSRALKVVEKSYDCNNYGSHIDMVLVYVYVPAFWGTFSQNLVYRSGGFHQRQRSPNFKIGHIFEQIIVKSTQFEQNWVQNWVLFY